jgi:hypothetical protein
MGVTESDLVSRVLDCDLDTAVAAFPVFWKQHEHLSRLELCPVDVPPSQWPVFAVFETLSDGKATRRYERARIFFSSRGWDDGGCVLAVRGSALCGFRPDGWGVSYPRSLPAISPGAIKSIPEQFAAYLERRGVVQSTTMPETESDSVDGYKRILQEIRSIFAEVLEDLDLRRYQVEPSNKLSDETAAYTIYRDGRALGQAKILVSPDRGHVTFTDMAREDGELELDQDWQRIKQALNRDLRSYFVWLNRHEWMQENTETLTRDDEEAVALPQPEPARDGAGKGMPLKPAKPKQGVPLSVWFDWRRACLDEGYKITLQDIADESGYSLSHVKKKHAIYRVEHEP